jgi:aryl-alcohol dehydrogenase-like predicted oxidoreductase
MRTVELGTTGEKVSALALGAMPLGSLAAEEPSIALLDRFTADGGTFIDTADCYAWWWAKGTDGGQSEDLLGRWMAARGNRDELFIATKGTARIRDVDQAWPEGATEPDWAVARRSFVGASAPVLRESVEASLRRLRTDRIDLYYVHVDDRATPLEETLQTLADLVAEGKIRHIGWSNVRTWRLERIRQLCLQHGWPTPVALQQEHSYLHRRAGLSNVSVVDDEQLDYLTEHPDLALVAYSPLVKGVYDMPDEEREAFYLWRENYAGEHQRAQIAAVREVAADLGATPSQVVLAWLMSRQAPRVVPIVGTSRVSRWTEAAGALSLELTPEHLARLADPEA